MASTVRAAVTGTIDPTDMSSKCPWGINSFVLFILTGIFRVGIPGLHLDLYRAHRGHHLGVPPLLQQILYGQGQAAGVQDEDKGHGVEPGRALRPSKEYAYNYQKDDDDHLGRIKSSARAGELLGTHWRPARRACQAWKRIRPTIAGVGTITCMYLRTQFCF